MGQEDLNTPNVSTEPFFHNARVEKLIREIAASDRLVVFAGAGTTIDRIGVTWKELVTQLVARHGEDFPDEQLHARSFVDRHMPPSTPGSSVLGLYRRVFANEATANQKLSTRIDDELYNRHGWQGGKLAANIARLAVERSLSGKRTCIITTNYDDYLEEALSEYREEALRNSRVSSISRRFEVNSSVALPRRDSLDIYYIHGIVPRPATGTVEVFPPVLGEPDYFESESRVNRVLEKGFRDTNAVLIVGSSLMDASLMRALWRTKSKVAQHPPRVALVPLQDPLWVNTAGDERVAHKRLFEARMGMVHCTPLFPDFYGQVGQFLNEIIVATSESYAAPNGTTYSERLEQWWKEWSRSTAVPFSLLRQRKHHQILKRLVDEICLITETQSVLKAEIWIRWDPRSSERKMRLWASSSAVIRNDAVMREGKIENKSDYVSIRAFCEGRPLLEPGTSGRWDDYLATPIWLEARGDIPVAVVTLASLRESDDALPKDVEKRREVLTLIELAGVAIASPR